MLFEIAVFALSICLYGSVAGRILEDPVIVNGRQLLQELSLEPVDGLDWIKEDAPVSQSTLFETIIGLNELRLINNTDNFPFRTFGRFQNLGCTGFLIQPRVVLTAGHCVYDRRRKQFFTDLNFSPGMNGPNEQPFGIMEWSTGRVTAEFANGGDDGYDYGIVILKESYVDLCQARGGTECDKLLNFAPECSDRTVILNIAGYRDDLEVVEDEKMWVSPCFDVPITCAVRTFDHVCDTTAGMAGAPIWLFRQKLDAANQPIPGEYVNVIRGIHIGVNSNNQTNKAVTVNDDVVARINQWVAQANL